MSIIDRLLTVLTPYECLGCAAEGDLVCTACIQQLIDIPQRCYRCDMSADNGRTCHGCRVASNLYQVWAGTAYSGIAKDLVWKLKFGGAQMAAKRMATRLVPLLDDNGFVVVPVPTAVSRVRRRGYDQAKLIARELSRQARLPYLDCLARSGRTHQVGASRDQRLAQLEGAFRVVTPEKIKNAHILLVDDVLTTGATMEVAAGLLKKHGAVRVSAAVFARA